MVARDVELDIAIEALQGHQTLKARFPERGRMGFAMGLNSIG